MKWLLLLSILVIVTAGNARAQTDDQARAERLADSIRALLLLEDTAVAGNLDAPVLERKMLDALATTSGANGAVSSQTATAILSLTLSGGQPGLAAQLLKTEGLQPIKQRLLQGAIAFANGDREKARQYLSGIDAARLAPSLGGRVALAQAILLPETQIIEKQRLFALASALMPGTLIEDAAERRAALLAAQGHDYRRMWKIARRYVIRMRPSLYATQFLAELAREMSDFPEADAIANEGELEAFLNLLEREERVTWYLDLSRRETRLGRKALAQFAADRALRDATPPSRNWQRARFYSAAWAIAESPAGQTAATLGKTDPGSLDQEENELLRAASEIARQIHADADAKHAVAAASTKQELTADQLSLSNRAANVLQSADTALASAGS